jgi:siderophore synthetase component
MYAKLESFEIEKTASATLVADLSLVEARKRGLQRTLQALFRENLLLKEHLIQEGAIAWLPLWAQQGMLRFDGLQIGGIGSCQLSGSISYYRTGARPQPISTPSALLTCVAHSLSGALLDAAAAADLQRLVGEVDNSMENDALCLAYRRGWAQRLIAEFGPDRTNFIAALRDAAPDNPALLLEQWGTLGHPWHPNYKTKLGLTAEQVVALSPEFQAVVPVSLAAIRADKAHVEFSGFGDNYRTWFARTYPDAWSQWEASLIRRQQDPAAWLPLPLHPYQARYLIPHKFAPEIVAGELMLLPDVSIAASPTMSFRTVVPAGSATMPHMKLPVSLRLTSVQRTVSPKSAVMGPRLTRLLNTMIEREHGFGGTLAIVPEDVGLHYLDPDGDDDRARHLAALFRANPMGMRTDRLFPVPVGALFADSPLNGRPLVTDLVALSFGDHAQGALQFFERYAETVAASVLSAYLLYGVAFEAHQQNSFIMIDRQSMPVQLLVRDFGDLRIHAPTLRASGLQLAPYRAGFTLFEDAQRPRDKFLHAIMLCHVAELGLLLSRTYDEPELGFWKALRRATEQAFDRLRPRVDPRRWEEERRALLEADWPAKSFLRMRLSDTSDDVVGGMPNPLKAASA